MQDHGAVPHGAMQCNHDAVHHGVMQKGSDCEIFTDSIYFVLKFWRRVNYSHFYQRPAQQVALAFPWPIRRESKKRDEHTKR
jgi:hypothetical protein